MRISKSLAALAVLVLAASACSSGTASSPPASAQPTSAPSTEASVTAAPESAAPTATAAAKKITFVAPLIADANWAGLNKCVVSKSAELGYDLTMVAPINETASTADMVSLTEQAIAAGTEGLIVVPLVAQSWDPVLATAKEKGIPVIAMGVDTSTPDQRNAFVGTDFLAYGAQSAELIAQAKGGKANVGILYSGPETTNQVDAIKVFRQVIADKYPDIKIIGDDTILSPGGNRDLVKTTEVARGFLVAHPEVDTIWSPDGQGGIAAAGAARDLGKQPGEITIVGADHLPQVKDDLEKGWEYASIAFVEFVGWGEGSVNALHAHFQGTLQEGATIFVIPAVFTKENP
ncbi:MAG: sugar ABC transporter substrate-binding protein [Aeromicrobium sp.]